MALRRAVEGDDAPPEKRILQQERQSGGIAPAAEGWSTLTLICHSRSPFRRVAPLRHDISRTVKEIHMTA